MKIKTFIETAESRKTSLEIMEAIFEVAEYDEEKAKRIWANPTEMELYDIWEKVTKVGTINSTDFTWGNTGRRWSWMRGKFQERSILNLTGEPLTEDQISVGVYDLPERETETLKELLDSNDFPNQKDISDKATKIAALTYDRAHMNVAMIGGPQWMIGPITAALTHRGITPLIEVISRTTETEKRGLGTIKVEKARHAGFVTAI